jgi:hypothetical protein
MASLSSPSKKVSSEPPVLPSAPTSASVYFGTSSVVDIGIYIQNDTTMEVIILLYYFGNEDRGQREEEWEKLRDKKEREENTSTSSLPYLRNH